MNLLQSIRLKLQKNKLDAFLLPKWGKYGGELQLAHENHLEMLTGFSGSAGFAFVTRDKAFLIVDGRYTEQAPQEAHPGFVVLEGGLTTIPELLRTFLTAAPRIAVPPAFFSYSQTHMLEKAFLCSLTSLTISEFTAPQVGPSTFTKAVDSNITALHLSETGISAAEKIDGLFAEMGEGPLFIHDPEELCWLLNIRGNDSPTTPIKFGRCLIDNERTAHVVWENPSPLPTWFPYKKIKVYESETALFKAIEDIKNIQISAHAPHYVVNSLREPRVLTSWPVAFHKARKNETEIRLMEGAQIEDNYIFFKLMHWLYLKDFHVTENEVVAYLNELRTKNERYLCPSFESIVGGGPNGSIIHYRPQHSRFFLKEHPMVLIDTGAHYKWGTTDTTRTLAAQEAPPHHMRDLYTRVLKGHLRLFLTPIPVGTTGAQLDVLARQDLWQVGRNFNHGTGHGVGHMLNVHEGPFSISPRSQLAVEPGVILTNEPGYYEPGEFGIRIENVAVVESVVKGYLQFRTLTYLPYDRKLILKEMLSAEELDYINQYHAEVYHKLNHDLTVAERVFLKTITAAL